MRPAARAPGRLGRSGPPRAASSARAVPLAALAAGLRDQPDGADLDAPLDALDHVVDRQRGDARRRQRLHLDPGRAGRGGLRPHPEHARGAVRRHRDDEVGQGQRVAERDQVARPLAAHHAGELGDAEDVALRPAAVDHEAHRLVADRHRGLRDGSARGERLVADVDHPRPAGPVDVGEAAALGARRSVPGHRAQYRGSGWPPVRRSVAVEPPQVDGAIRPAARRRSRGRSRGRPRSPSAERTWLPCPRPPPASRTGTRPSASRTVRPSASRSVMTRRNAAPARALRDVVAEDRPVRRPEQPVRGQAGQLPDRRPDEQLERHEARDRVPGQAEQERRVAAIRRARRPRRRTACPAARRPARARSGRSPRRPPGRRRTARPRRRPTRSSRRPGPPGRPRGGPGRPRADPPRSRSCGPRPRPPRRAPRAPGRSRRGSRPGRARVPPPGPRRPVARTPTTRPPVDPQRLVAGARGEGDRGRRQPAPGAQDHDRLVRGRRPPSGSPSRARSPRGRAPTAGSGPAASRPRSPVGAPSASAGVVSSTWTTASARGGTGAPVAIRIAVPRSTAGSGATPARDLADHLEADRRAVGRAGHVARRGSRSRPSPSCPTAAAPSGSSRPRRGSGRAPRSRKTCSTSVGPGIAARTRSRASSTLRSRSVTAPRHRAWPLRLGPGVEERGDRATGQHPAEDRPVEDRQPVEMRDPQPLEGVGQAVVRARRPASVSPPTITSSDRVVGQLRWGTARTWAAPTIPTTASSRTTGSAGPTVPSRIDGRERVERQLRRRASRGPSPSPRRRGCPGRGRRGRASGRRDRADAIRNQPTSPVMIPSNVSSVEDEREADDQERAAGPAADAAGDAASRTAGRRSAPRRSPGRSGRRRAGTPARGSPRRGRGPGRR